MAVRAWAFWIAAALACAPAVCAQPNRVNRLGSGAILVASRDLLDPNFAHTVVFIAQYSENGGVMGLVINKRSKIPVSDALNIPEAKGRTEPLYLGGPVERTTLMALGRLPEPSSGAVRVMGEIYLMVEKTLLKKTLALSKGDSGLRLYAGYAGWSGPQLRQEVRAGAWFIMQGSPAVVFDTNPASLWTRLIEKFESNVALNLPRSGWVVAP
jgi:putative transcriptional regulator